MAFRISAPAWSRRSPSRTRPNHQVTCRLWLAPPTPPRRKGEDHVSSHLCICHRRQFPNLYLPMAPPPGTAFALWDHVQYALFETHISRSRILNSSSLWFQTDHKGRIVRPMVCKRGGTRASRLSHPNPLWDGRWDRMGRDRVRLDPGSDWMVDPGEVARGSGIARSLVEWGLGEWSRCRAISHKSCARCPMPDRSLRILDAG